MKDRFFALAPMALLLAGVLITLPLAADPPPDPISIDAHSPSNFLCGIPTNPADIYGIMGGIIGQGCDAGFPGPILHLPAPGYGLTPQDENDGHSAGEQDANARVAVYFSGDRASQGVPLTEYAVQENNFQAAGDRFVTNGFTFTSPAGAFAACAPTFIGPPVFPGRGPNLLSLNQTWYNEIPSVGPSVLNRLRYLDNLDAVELDLFDRDMDGLLDPSGIYFTVDKAGPTFPGFPSHIFFTPGGGFPGIFSTPGQIGVTNRDNVDAVAVWDRNGNGVADPGQDYAIFSLDRGSPSLAGQSAADIFVTNFTGIFCPFLLAGDLGLQHCDNVDALDVEIGQVEVFEEEPPVEEEPGDPDIDPTIEPGDG